MSWNKHRERLQFGLIGVLLVAVVWLALRPATTVPEPVGESAIGGMGWVDSEELSAPITATIPQFSDTPAFNAVRGEEPKEVFLWHAYRVLFGENSPEWDQGGVGSCTAHGFGNAIEDALANQILAGDPGEFRFVSREVLYAGSRINILRGQIRGDGSTGSANAKFITTVGVAACGKYASADLTRYEESRCRAWGRSGMPAELEAECRKFPVGSAALVRSWEECKRACQNGYPTAVCSSQGFTMRRDDRGICRPSGTWMHCMEIDGYKIDADGKEYGHIENSWGPNAHTGPVGWGNPNRAGFWTDAKTIDRMLRQGDSFAISGVTGFPARRIDWNVKAEPRVRRPALAFARFEPKVLSW